ncbi:MAG: chromosome segregation protein SMC [bacterium]|nr:chromosome segregation protein SMC [bacterium]
MLTLEKMQISGFKSFSDKTEVKFQGGITAVVGPNGCGKSNIGDALNWVLGEQSPRLLRGKQMADVIFNGSAGRKPLGLAEVSLHLSGAEGMPRCEQGTMVITRRLYRSGESDYLINGARARLRDIQELLNAARVGARSYATIEQGKIDQILNAKPKERRLLIEDAAGVSGYKQKRRLTELKLEATQANLLRVNDIVVEVERQIRSLKRQAARARRYRKLRDELREKERIRFGVRGRALDAELTDLQKTETSSRDQEAETAAQLARLEVELEEERTALETAGNTFRETAEKLHQLELEIDREEARIRSSKEKKAESIEAAERHETQAKELSTRHVELLERGKQHEERLAEATTQLEEIGVRMDERQQALLDAEQRHRSRVEETETLRRGHFEAVNRAVELRNRARSTEEALQRNAAQIERLDAERTSSNEDWNRLTHQKGEIEREREQQRVDVEQQRAACAELDTNLRAAKESHTAEAAELAAAREAEKSAVARLATLQDVATRFAGVSDGVRTLLGSGPERGITPVGVVADFIEAGADVEGVAESYLQTFLPTVILDDDDEVERAAEILRATGAGRTSLISRAQPSGGCAVGVTPNGHGDVPAEVLGDPRVHGRLRDRVTLRASSNGVVGDRLGDAVLVDDLPAALELHRQYPSTDYITSAGEVVYASGVISAGGRQNGDQGLLAHKRKMDEAQAHASEASALVARHQERTGELAGEVQGFEHELHASRSALERATHRAVELEVQAKQSAEETAKTGRRTEVLKDEIAALGEEAAGLGESFAQLQAESTDADGSESELEQQLGERASVLEQAQGDLRSLSEDLATVRAEQAAGQARLESLTGEGRRLAESLDEMRARLESSQAESGEARMRAKAAEELRLATEQEMIRHLEERETLGRDGQKMERDINERREKLAARENGLRGIREQLESVREQTRDAELRRTKAETEREHLDDLCNQELGCTVSEAALLAGDALEDADLEALEEEVQSVRAGIERIGPVNMAAIEEFTELEERHEFLTAQRTDLEDSMASLREQTRRINRTSRERFQKAFEAIRASYQEVFQLLFNGGRADLCLEEGEDVLEAGIEILVQPPGKRLGSIQLMSGGEKALSAIALLFAVFRYQPSPFCLLDEVDAALDDANVGRFAHMVKEYAEQTQFILITHNKLSMESANLMYGVTMEEPGVSKLMSLQLQ